MAPLWRDETSLYVATDWTGWWNIYQVGADRRSRPRRCSRPRRSSPRRCGSSAARPFALLGDGRLAVLHGRGGERLGILDPETCDLTDLEHARSASSPVRRSPRTGP